MDIMELLANILNPNPGQNRLVNPNANGPNYLTQTGLGPEQLARFHQMSGMGGQAAPATSMPEAGPPAVSGPATAPQPDQQRTASVAAPAASGGGLLSRLFGGGQSDGENQTIQWLQQQGMDPGTATIMARSKPALQQYLLERSQGTDPMKALQAEKLGLEIEQMRNPKDKDNAFSERATAATQYGLTPGSPEYQRFILSGDLPSNRDQDPAFKNEMELRKEYDMLPEVKDYKVVRSNYERIRQGVQLGTGAGDAAIVFGYMKMLDPTSVVREGEQATTRNAAGVPEAIRGMYNQVLGEGQLSAEARNQILAASEKVYGESVANIKDVNKRYGEYAGSWKLDPTRIVATPEQYDPLGATDPALPPPGPAIAAPEGAAAPGAVAPGGVDVSKMPPPQGISPEVWKHVPPEKRKLWAQ